MHISAVVGGPLETVGYLVYEQNGGPAIIVDTPLGSVRRFMSVVSAHDLEVQLIVNTHGHWDHIAENNALVKATGAQLCAHTWDATRLANPSLATEDEPGMPVAPSKADRSLPDGEVLEVGSLRLAVLHTPGHTPGSVCLHEAAHGALFTGDTLYRLGVGRTDVPGGNANQLLASLRKLAALPDTTRIYPDHGLPTTLGSERWLLDLAIIENAR